MLAEEQLKCFAKLWQAYPIKGSQTDADEAQAIFAQLVAKLPEWGTEAVITTVVQQMKARSFTRPLAQTLKRAIETQEEASRDGEHEKRGQP